jgi:hypothetical protein
MNERIKELANKAVGKRSCYMIEAEYIKFAELIVRECASIAGKAEYSDTWLEPVEDAIKKHFGVEE